MSLGVSWVPLPIVRVVLRAQFLCIKTKEVVVALTTADNVPKQRTNERPPKEPLDVKFSREAGTAMV